MSPWGNAGAVPGLSQARAALGAGSLFGQIADAVPGTEALVSEARNAGLPAAPSSPACRA